MRVSFGKLPRFESFELLGVGRLSETRASAGRAIGILRTTTIMLCGVLAAVSCDRPGSISEPAEVSKLDGKALNAKKMAELRRFEEGGCAVSAKDSGGVLRGFAITREKLPFI